MSFTLIDDKKEVFDFLKRNKVLDSKPVFDIIDYYLVNKKNISLSNDIIKNLKNDKYLMINTGFFDFEPLYGYITNKRIYFEKIIGIENFNGNKHVRYFGIIDSNEVFEIIDKEINNGNSNLIDLVSKIHNLLINDYFIFINDTTTNYTDITGYIGKGKSNKAIYDKKYNFTLLLKKLSKKFNNSDSYYKLFIKLILGIELSEEEKKLKEKFNSSFTIKELINHLSKDKNFSFIKDFLNYDNYKQASDILEDFFEYNYIYLDGFICENCSCYTADYNLIFNNNRKEIIFTCRYCGHENVRKI